MSDDVRVARPADLPALLQLAGAFYAEGGFSTPPHQLRANLGVMLDSRSVRVAVVQPRTSRPIGFAITTTTFGLENGLVAELQDLYVAFQHRGRRLGERLIADSAEWAHARGATQLEVVLAPNGRNIQRLAAYYSRCGFIDEHRRLITRPLS